MDGRKVAVDLSGAFQNGKGKEALASSLLPQLIVQQQLQRVALVTSAWIVWAADDMGEQVRPSQHPRRKEVVSVYACSDGVESISMAEIKRDGVRPPWLAGWQQMSTQDRNAASFAGLFAPPLRAAVNVVRRGKRL